MMPELRPINFAQRLAMGQQQAQQREMTDRQDERQSQMMELRKLAEQRAQEQHGLGIQAQQQQMDLQNLSMEQQQAKMQQMAIQAMGSATKNLMQVPQGMRSQWLNQARQVNPFLGRVLDQIPEDQLTEEALTNENIARFQLMLSSGVQPESTSPTANIRDFEYYQSLAEKDPELAKKFGRKANLESDEGQKLSPFYQRQLNEYVDQTVEAQRNAQKYDAIASEFEKVDPVAGLAGGVSEYLKEVTGSEDAITELRKEYLRIRASEAIKNLPPGPATDKDVQMVLAGFPKSTAKPETMASFLRGLSKIQEQVASYNEFKAKYLSEKGHERGMLDAWKELNPERAEDKPEPGKTRVKWGDL